MTITREFHALRGLFWVGTQVYAISVSALTPRVKALGYDTVS